jgi:hypothetical protein
VPFEALVVTPPTEERATVHWIDVGPAIAYQESGSALVWAQARRREQNARPIPPLALIVADPAYGGTAAGAAGKRKAPVVTHVQRGGLGARAGVMAGDALLSVAGHTLESVSEGERWLVEARDPDGTPLVVDRAGVELRLKLPHGEAGLELASHLPPELRRGSDAMRSASLERLPGTAREAAAVRSALESGASSEVRVLVGGEATETLLTAWASSASILHIAAHQVPDPTGCSESGRLALTAPLYATAEDDGFIDLDDLLIHWRGRLEHCGLAVLSSCWSRVGRLVPDEGFFGLPLGLRFAGCPSVVSSLWPVDDASAAELMSTFYTDLEVGSSGNRLGAFRRARRELKRTWPDPYYWAAFVWSGAPD